MSLKVDFGGAEVFLRGHDFCRRAVQFEFDKMVIYST